jgi:hypothetical protein
VLYEIINQHRPKPEELKLADAFIHAKDDSSRVAGEMVKPKQNGKSNELVRDPNAARVSRNVLNAREKFVQALLMTSEAAFLD